MNVPVILCVGGDARYVYACEELCRLGKVFSYGACGYTGATVRLCSPEQMTAGAELLVLPMLSQSGLDIKLADGKTVSCRSLSGLLAKNALVVGGRLNTDVIEYFSSLGHDVADFFTREELVIRNCVPTAEGALQIALRELAVTVDGTRTLMIGYGRVAKACAKLFSAVGSDVTVAARKLSQLAQAQNDGCKAIGLNSIAENIGSFDIVINTVPAMVLTKQILERLGKDAIVIDLASMPGGTDFEAAKQLDRRVVHALALPGKTAPVTSGRLIAEAVINIFLERRETDVFTRR